MPTPTIHHINCGTMCPLGHELLGNGSHGGRLVCHVLLLELPERLVLVDTGFGSDDVRHPGQLGQPFRAVVRPRLALGETAAEQVRALGYAPTEVTDVIVTHLDIDHAGGLPDFPQARVHLFAREHQVALSPPLSQRIRYHDARVHWRHGPRWVTHELQGDSWEGFDSIRVLEGGDAEVLLVPLQGHTFGHTGVAVRRPAGGWLLHCGDAYFHRGEMLSPPRGPAALEVFQRLLGADGALRRRNQERLRDLAASRGGEITLFCSHDPVELERARASD
ncbi:MAG: MBL fold metallo-hydrolase [Solirubrobacteraceae bacterium]